jgi:hypothetical protein
MDNISNDNDNDQIYRGKNDLFNNILVDTAHNSISNDNVNGQIYRDRNNWNNLNVPVHVDKDYSNIYNDNVDDQKSSDCDDDDGHDYVTTGKPKRNIPIVLKNLDLFSSKRNVLNTSPSNREQDSYGDKFYDDLEENDDSYREDDTYTNRDKKYNAYDTPRIRKECMDESVDVEDDTNNSEYHKVQQGVNEDLMELKNEFFFTDDITSRLPEKEKDLLCSKCKDFKYIEGTYLKKIDYASEEKQQKDHQIDLKDKLLDEQSQHINERDEEIRLKTRETEGLSVELKTVRAKSEDDWTKYNKKIEDYKIKYNELQEKYKNLENLMIEKDDELKNMDVVLNTVRKKNLDVKEESDEKVLVSDKENQQQKETIGNQIIEIVKQKAQIEKLQKKIKEQNNSIKTHDDTQKLITEKSLKSLN